MSMTFAEIRELVLKAMGVQDAFTLDDNPAAEYRVMLGAYINEGYAQVTQGAWRPRRRETVLLDDELCIDVGALSAHGGEPLAVTHAHDTDGRGLCVKEMPDGRLTLPCAKPGQSVTVTYTWMPPLLTRDADEPLFRPRACHPMLADYALYRLTGHFAGGDPRRAEVHYAAFIQQMRSVERSPWPSAIANKTAPQKSGGRKWSAHG